VERRAGKHRAIEVRERGTERKGLAVGDVQDGAADVRAMQVKRGGEERTFDGMPKSARSACHAAGVPSAISMFGIRPPMIPAQYISQRSSRSTGGYDAIRPVTLWRAPGNRTT